MCRFICGFAAASLVLNTAQALDLTPKSGSRQGNEGGPTPTLVFSDGKARFDYVPPLDWRPSGGGNTLTFYTPDPKVSMRLMVVGKGNSPQMDDSTSKEDLQAWARKFMPGGAEKVEFVRLAAGQFPMEGRGVNECVFKYEFAGASAAISISVIEFNEKERLLMIVSAPGKAFDQIRQQAISSMGTWARVQ